MWKNKITKIAILFIVISLLVVACVSLVPRESNLQLPSENRFPKQSYQLLDEHTFFSKAYDNNAKLIINDVDYSSQTYVHFNHTKGTVELPLLFISKQLGAKVYVLTENKYLISFSDEDYILNTEIKKLSVYNQGMNIIGDPKPITNPYANNQSHIEPIYKILGNDFIVENIVIEHFLFMRNAKIQIKDNNVAIDTVQPSMYKLEFNDRVIGSVKVDENKSYAEIPFSIVVKELGGKFYKVAPDLYHVKMNGNKLYFNSKDIVFSDIKDGSNLLGSASGGKLWTYYKINNNEIFIDSTSAQIFLNRVGYKLNIDNQEKVVKILEI